MGQPLFQQLESWQEGVLTDTKADLLPPTASPRAWNSYLSHTSAATAVPAKRGGLSCQNVTPVIDSPTILGQVDYRRQASGSISSYHLLISALGRLDLLSSGAAAAWDSAIPVPFTTGTYYPSTAVANNMAFIVNGQSGDNKKATIVSSVNTVQSFGITRPTVGTLAGADGGGAGLFAGTYEIRVSYYNSNTGHQSSISNTATATVTVASRSIAFSNIPVSPDTQVTHRYIYVRDTAEDAYFKRDATMIVANNTATTATFSVLDTSRTILAPDTEENNPPPTLTGLAWHKSRMFGFGPDNPSYLLYSKAGLPEAFDPEAFERINVDDGKILTALHSAHDVLMIFKHEALYVLDGDDPANWVVRLVDPRMGCTSPQSIQTIDGITYWWSILGPVAWSGSGVPELIGVNFIAPTIDADALNFSYLANIASAVDSQQQHMLWALPESGESRNTVIVPYNYSLRRWVSDKWDPFNIASMQTIIDSSGVPWVMVGGYRGQVFKLWDTDNDGVVSGTASGSFTASSTTITTFTDGAALFDTTGGALTERIVRIFDTDTSELVARRIITANTATTLTFSDVDLQSGIVYEYTVGGPDFQFDTHWNNFGTPFWKKRFEFLYVSFETAASPVTVYIDLFLDNNITTAARNYSIETAAGSGIYWNQVNWNEFNWPGGVEIDVIDRRKRIYKTGKNWRIRVRNHNPDEPVTLLKLAMRAELLTDKR